MGIVQHGGKKLEVFEGRPNEVISITTVQVVMVKFTNSEGFVDTALALCFGKDTQDQKAPGIYMVESNKLKELLTIPFPHIKAGVRAKLAALGPAVLPETTALELDHFEAAEDKHG